MKILLTGASGFIGRHITAALGAAGHEVVAICRHTGVDFNNMRSPADWQGHLAGIDAVINAVGIIAERRGQTFSALHTRAPVALFRACAEAGVRRVVQLSALGADERAITPYHTSKKAADDALRDLPLDWFVLRPSLVYGPGGQSTALFRRLANLPLIPVIARGMQQIQPVHIDDLVATVVACLTTVPARRTLDVVGPHVFTFGEWLQALRVHGGKSRALTLSIPWPLARLAARVMPLLSPDNLRMLQQGNTADVQPLAAFLGRMPRALP